MVRQSSLVCGFEFVVKQQTQRQICHHKRLFVSVALQANLFFFFLNVDVSPGNRITIVISASNRADRSATRADPRFQWEPESDFDDVEQKSQSSDRDSSFWLCHAVRGGTWPSSEEETSFWIQDNVRVINTAFKSSTNGGKKTKNKPSSEACFDKLSSCHSDQTLWSLTSGKEREKKNTAARCLKINIFTHDSKR